MEQKRKMTREDIIPTLIFFLAFPLAVETDPEYVLALCKNVLVGIFLISFSGFLTLREKDEVLEHSPDFLKVVNSLKQSAGWTLVFAGIGLLALKMDWRSDVDIKILRSLGLAAVTSFFLTINSALRIVKTAENKTEKDKH